MKYSNSAYWEIFYPFIFTLLITIIYFLSPYNCFFDFKNLVDSSLNLFGILIGFLITVLTILNTIENSYTRALKNGDSYHLLTMYLKHSIWGCFFSIICAILYVFFINSILDSYIKYANSIFLLTFLFAIFSSYRFIKIFLKLTLKNK